MPTTIYSFSSASGSSWSNASYATRDDSNRASYAANANSNISELIASGNFYTESGTNIVDGTNIKITKVEIGLKGYVSGANCYVNSELRLPDGSTWALGERLSATSETTVWKDLTSSYSWTASNIDDVQARCSGRNSNTKNSRTVYVNCFLVRITWEYEVKYTPSGSTSFTSTAEKTIEISRIASGSTVLSSGYEASNTLHKNYESFGVFNLHNDYVNYYFYNAFYSYKLIQKNINFLGGEEYKLGYNIIYDSYFNIIIFGGIKESTCDYIHETSGNINFKTNINNKIEYINYDSVGLININSASKYRVEFNYKILGKIEFNSATLVNLNCNTICYGGLNINETTIQFINEIYFDSCINVSFNNNTLYKVNYNNHISECLVNFNYDGIYNYDRNYKYKSNGILNLNSGVSYSCGYNYLYNSYSYVILGGKGITNDFCINHLETPIQINITYTRRNYYLCREYISSGLILFDGISNYISSFNYYSLNNIIYLNNITYTYHSSDYVYNSNNRKLYLNGSSVVNEVEYILNCNHGFVINGYNKSKIDFSYFNTDSQLTIDSDDIHGLIIYNYKSSGGFSFNDHVHENVDYQYNSNGKINFGASNVGVIDFVYNYVDQHKIELFPSYCLNIEEKYYSEGNINICRTIPTSIFINFSYVSIGNLSIENPTLQALYEICFIVKETRRRIIFSGRPIYYPIRALYEQEINLQSEIGTVLYSKSKINDNTNVYSEIEKLVILRSKINSLNI